MVRMRPLLSVAPRGVERPRPVVRSARLSHRRVRSFGRPSDGAAFGGHLSLTWLPATQGEARSLGHICEATEFRLDEAGLERNWRRQAIIEPRGIIRVVERCATPWAAVTTPAPRRSNRLTCDDGCPVPLAGLEPATCCLGDSCSVP